MLLDTLSLYHDDRPPTDAEVWSVISALDIQPAAIRQYLVHHAGQEIQSLCIGLSARRGQLTCQSLQLVAVFVVLTKWLRGDDRFKDFSFTSITINRAHAAAVHRDSANIGPSVVRTLGDYNGGKLFWFPQDEGVEDVMSFSFDQSSELDTSMFQMFDGNKAHGVTPFTGDRMSVIFFTSKQIEWADEPALTSLLEWDALRNPGDLGDLNYIGQ